MAQLTLLPDNNDPTLAFARSELMVHLKLLPLHYNIEEDGFPITLRVDPSLSESGADAYRFAFTAQGGDICGSSPRAVLLGVYGYLRKIGFVFLRPDKGGTYVPALTRREDLLCPPISHTASFFHRGVCVEGADSLENALDFIDWLPKVGFNSFFVQFKKPDIFFERWYGHTFNPLLSPEHKTRQELDEMERALTQAMTLRGILDHRVGHGWTAEALGFSNTGWREEDLSPGSNIEPLIAQIDGVRRLRHGIPTNTNLCYANPEARRRLTEQVVSYAKANKNVNYLHFWLADEYNNICECPACAETTLSDQYVEILNGIDEALTAEGLDTKIVFLLYQELLYAPIQAKLRHPERFCLMFAPISRTFEKAYPRHSISREVPPYVRNRMKLPETVEGNLAHYYRWKDSFRGDSFFYDYPLGRAHYGDFGYMKIARVIYDDIHALKALDSNGYMSCQELRAACPTAFPNFVMGQALLDESLSYEELKQTYFRAMFGPGWEAVAEYLEQLSALSDTDYFNGHGPRLQPEKAPRFRRIGETSAAFLETMDTLHPDLPEYRENWEFLRFHGRYCVLLSAALEALCTGDSSAAARFEAFCAHIRENEPRWQPQLDVYRVIEVATNYTGFPRS